MVFELLKRAFTGVAWGGLITFIALTILMLNDINSDVETIWLYMMASLVIGIYFGIGSFIFTHLSWSPLAQITVHFLLSLIVYFSFAFPLEWIPLKVTSILLALVFFIIIYAIFWSGFHFYFKKIEIDMNDSLSKK